MASYPVLSDDEWIVPVRKGFRLMCCHCSLVHDVDIKVTKAGEMSMRFRRNARSTALARRKQKK